MNPSSLSIANSPNGNSSAGFAGLKNNFSDIEDFGQHLNIKNKSEDIKIRHLVKHLTLNPQISPQIIIKDLYKRFKMKPVSKFTFRQYYQDMLNEHVISKSETFEEFIRFRACRENQGVIVLTTVMAPKEISCQFDCHYCPNHPEHPRSYVPQEPAVDRARENDWEAIMQVDARIIQYIRTGIIDYHQKKAAYKIDAIVEGGTYTSYSKDYRMEFIHDLFYACNTFHERNLEGDIFKSGQDHSLIKKNKEDDEIFLKKLNKLKTTEKETADFNYSSQNISSARPKLSLQEEKDINQFATFRIIGLSIETRPDTISLKLLQELRLLGVTRVQIGVQHLNDEILKLINRQCYTVHTRRALKLLFDNAFKVAVHYMPDLPGSSPEEDLAMWEQLFSDPSLEFDYVKIYPCMTMPFTTIKKWYEEGKYQPYAEDPEKIIAVCADFMMRLKKHQRLERMQRDLPTAPQIAGSNKTNLRQLVLDKLEKEKAKIREIRYREVKDRKVDYEKVKMVVEEYSSCGGTEKFISFESEDEKILLGFLRLRLVDREFNVSMKDLEGCALIREIHVYGRSVKVEKKRRGNLIEREINLQGAESGSEDSFSFGNLSEVSIASSSSINSNISNISNFAQHRGYGSELLLAAEKIAKEEGYRKIAVISGEGVRDYYRQRGFYDGNYYMFKDL